ncbi:MAG TPA: response regulator [Nitrososphaeraceae archaeon]|nr:response regulator [Nitrososphaeraceae archaeon]
MGRKRLVTKRRLVAIVDDEKDITGLFTDALKRIDGISIVAFNDPTIALEHFKTNFDAYAVVISDFRMPEINGIELLKNVKDSNPLVRTILVSAYSLEDPELEECIKNEIINNFIQKPIRLAHLLEEVNNQLHLYELNKK